MNLEFDTHDRTVLAALADVLIPAGDGFPSASQAGVAAEGLDQAITFRPDFASALKKLLEKVQGRPTHDVVADLRANHPETFAVLADFVPGAYFLNEEVRTKLGYSGQTPKAIDPRPDSLDDGLLQPVIKRGPIYRPTPPRNSRSESV